ncbi:MAG: GNAT family N-acetyltransferase, partial [Bacillota bacterium]
LARALDTLREARATYVELTTQVDNQTSRGLYESFGFSVVSSDWLLRKTLAR